MLAFWLMPTIRVFWDNPPTGRLTIERGRMVRELGPRGLLDLEEAAAVLDRPQRDVRRAIGSGFLRARRRGRQLYVTVQACTEFLEEEAHGAEASGRVLERIKAGRERVVPWEVARKQL